MKVEKKNLAKSQLELVISLSVEEFKPYVLLGAKKISKEVKIEGFRPGKVPYNILKQKISEMTILEESARIAINKTLDEVIRDNVSDNPIGQPQIEIIKIAPNNPMKYKITLSLLPKIELGEYKDLKIKEKKVKVEDKEVEKILQDLQEMRVKETAVNREIKDGDKAIVDIQMFLDKVPIEGGQGKNTTIIIGKNYIIPGFDKKILGAKKTEVKEFALVYPKDYHMKNIAGKKVEFKVEIKDVFKRELPEFNDTFAQGFGLKNIQELKNNLKNSAIEQKKKELAQSAEKEMLEKIMASSRFGDIPEMLVDQEVKTMLSELEQAILKQGGKFDDYLTSINKTRDQLTLDILPDAVKRVKISLLIREIGEKEKISATKEEIDSYLDELKKHYKEDKEMSAQIITPAYRNYVANVLSSKKLINKLRKWNIE